MPTVYLSLGTNLGDRERLLAQAIHALTHAAIVVTERSSLYETDPQDFLNQPAFLNLAVRCETQLSPDDLLAAIGAIEQGLGRIRKSGPAKGPRTIDIDILLYDEAVREDAALTIPHARMMQRRFVLEPLAEIAPGLRHPITGELIFLALSKLTGQRVRKIGGQSDRRV